MKNEGIMQAAQVVRVIDHGAVVQLLCADGQGLLSVYVEHKPFSLFCKAIQKAGLKLKGLQIRYDRDGVHVPALGKTRMSHAT